MPSNSFGQHFKITTWGESHGPAIGVVIDGCPAGLALDLTEIQAQLDQRRPGNTAHTSPRNEADQVQLLSGLFEGKTTGAPISLLINNQDARPQDYTELEQILRPGHANYTYLEKYGIFDHRGGGRASARETACRVAAGAIANQLLTRHSNIQIHAYLQAVGPHSCQHPWLDPIPNGGLTCPDAKTAQKIQQLLAQTSQQGNSLGGCVGFVATGLPVGLGEPVYDKLEACLAHAMLSIPASKGFEIGQGFASSQMLGSEHNDGFTSDTDGQPELTSNNAGGTLGGISSGQPLWGRVAFKPTSSIKQPQATTDTNGNPHTLSLSSRARHDPCVAIRAVPVVKAMCALVLADTWLAQRLNRV